jgi:hypothetical protein
VNRTHIELAFALIGFFGSACAPQILKPPCQNPAKLEGHWDRRAPGYIVSLKPGPDFRTSADAFIERHGLHARGTSERSFSVGDIDPEMLATLRCEPFVKAVIHNAVFENVVQSGT